MVRGRVFAQAGIIAIVLLSLVLAAASGWQTRFPAPWLPLWVLGIGLALSMRSAARSLLGALARACVVLGAAASILALVVRWLR